MSPIGFDDAVRCRDCEFCNEHFGEYVCGLFTVKAGAKSIIWKVDQLDFCSWGKRKKWNGTTSKRR